MKHESIHDQTYRRYQGERRPVGHAWRVIASDGIRQMLAKRVFLGLFIFAWIPFIVRAVQMYFATSLGGSVPQASAFCPFRPTRSGTSWINRACLCSS